MKNVKCCSVRLKALIEITPLAYLAVSFDGSEDIIPKSQVFGRDYEVTKTEAYWISSWILSKKKIQYSCKKTAWFDKDTGEQLPDYHIYHHKPKRLNKKIKIDDSLKR